MMKRALGAVLGAALLCAIPASAQQAQADGQSVVVSGQRDLSNWLRAESRRCGGGDPC
jgi:hypothetical protein